VPPLRQHFAVGQFGIAALGETAIRVKLTTIRYGDPAHRDITGLRQLLQQYVDMVMAFARDVGR
jgi:hypothetical protein